MYAKLTPTKEQLPYLAGILGPLLTWIEQTPETHNLKESLQDYYGLPLFSMTGGTLEATPDNPHTNATYSYPEDPTLNAIYTVFRENETVHIFEHCIVGIIYKNDDTGDMTTDVFRMD